MKLLKILSFALIFGISLSSCNNNAKEESEDSPQKVQISEKGMITKKDTINFYEEGTHLLTTKEGEKYILKSSVLDISEFEGEMSTINGEKESPTGGQKYPLVTVFSIDREIPEGEERQSIFNEEDYFFVGRLPTSWKREITESKVLTFFPEGEAPVISVETFPLASLEVKKEMKAAKKIANVTIGGRNAQRVLENGGKVIIYFEIEEKGKYVRFSFEPGSEPSEQRLTFYEMMSDLEWSVKQKKVEPESGRVHCGGVARKRCPSGFRCELTSMDADATGICVSGTTSPSEVSGILSEEVFFGDADEELQEEEEDEEEKGIEESETETIDAEGLEGFVPNFNKYETYNNKIHHFNFKIPNSWWWRGVGSQEEVLSRIEVSDEEVDDHNAFVFIDVVSGSVSSIFEQSGSVYRISIPRDDDTHYEVHGKNEYKEQMRNIAHSIELAEEE